MRNTPRATVLVSFSQHQRRQAAGHSHSDVQVYVQACLPRKMNLSEGHGIVNTLIYLVHVHFSFLYTLVLLICESCDINAIYLEYGYCFTVPTPRKINRKSAQSRRTYRCLEEVTAPE